MVLFLLAPSTSVAQTQQEGPRVAILFSTLNDLGRLATEVDAALLRDLSAIAGINRPTVSPIEYNEIQLTVGCEDESRACLASIAKLVQVEAVLVRTLKKQPDGAVDLSLLYFDTSSDEDPTIVQIRGQPPGASGSLADEVPALVRSLFNIPETATAAGQEQIDQGGPLPIENESIPKQSEETETGIGTLTWVALGGGLAVLTAGIVVGLTAEAAYEDYKKSEIIVEKDIKKAQSDYDNAQSLGLIATILIPTGGVLIALGGTLLALDLLDKNQEQPNENAQLGYQPLNGGGMITLNGSWQGSF